jgi:uncharacterized membrane protein YsdA (DUF1294 family)
MSEWVMITIVSIVVLSIYLLDKSKESKKIQFK